MHTKTLKVGNLWYAACYYPDIDYWMYTNKGQTTEKEAQADIDWYLDMQLKRPLE